MQTPSQPPAPRLSPSLPVSTYAHASVSDAVYCPPNSSARSGARPHVAGRARGGSLDETTAAAAADLATLAAGRPRFFRGPLVRRPFWWAARPPLLAISRCFSGDIDAKPRRSLRSPFTIRPLTESFIASLSLGHPSAISPPVTTSGGRRLRRRILDGRRFRFVGRSVGRALRFILRGSVCFFSVCTRKSFDTSNYRRAALSKRVPRIAARPTAESARKSLKNHT